MGNEKGKESILILQLSVCAAIFMVAMFAGVYVIMTRPLQILFLVIAFVIMAGAIFGFVASVIRHLAAKEKMREQQYENIMKSEKALYLLLRKYGAQMEENKGAQDLVVAKAAEAVTNTVKNSAKIMVAREHEDIDALFNAIDAVEQRINTFENKLVENDAEQKRAIDSQAGAIEAQYKDTEKLVEAKQREIMEGMLRMENSIKDNLLQIAAKTASVAPQVSYVAAPTPAPMPAPQVLA